MGRHLLILLSLCFLALRGSHASVSPEDYWKYKLPTTPMPQSIKDSLHPSGKIATNSVTNSLQSTSGYDGLLSYAKDSTKNSLASSNAYGGLLSNAKDSLHSTCDGEHLLSDSTKKSLASASGYDGLLSYAENSAKDSLISTSGYDDSLSYAKDSIKESLAGENGYDGLLSYAKDSVKESLGSAKGYDGLLSYAKDSIKESLGSAKGYDGLLSYAKDSIKESLASAKGYDGLLSYAKAATKDSLRNSNGYDGLLSYAKDSIKGSLTSAQAYGGLLSYADDSTKNSDAKSSRKMLTNTNGYDGLLSYTEKSPSSATNSLMKDQTFFVEANLHHGKKMTLVFQKGTKKNLYFLPREVSNKIPFSSNKLSQIYNILSMDPKSQEAHVLSNRIELCEEPKVENVEKKCVTSLESMVDFVISEIGDNVKAMTTNLEKDYPKMEYTIEKVTKMSKNDHETVVCHKMGYPYAVFFCHGTATIRSYKVSLVGNDGTRIEAIAACHKETNAVLRKYMVDVLKVVPGSTRVCHFPGAEDNIIWVAE